jgi:hypothetical protein
MIGRARFGGFMASPFRQTQVSRFVQARDDVASQNPRHEPTRFAPQPPELSMIDLDNPACTCNQCIGSACSCGCRDSAARDLQAGGADCACPVGCGCDGNEQGCSCAAAS